MSGVIGGGGKKTSGRSVATKALIINEYKRRLRDNIRSLNDNFVKIVSAVKINTDDAAHKAQNTSKMTEYYTVRNEAAARAALIVRACDELLRLTNDLKEFLILHDFNFLTNAITNAEKECERRMGVQMGRHNALRLETTQLAVDIDRELLEHFYIRQ